MANLTLLCSITDGVKKSHWEDVTGSTPLSLTPDGCLLFTTTVSARFWLVYTKQRRENYHDGDGAGTNAESEIARCAALVYERLICVPYMAKFVVFAKRRNLSEASLRVFCVLNDEADKKPLEAQEHYTQVAKSRDVQVYDGQTVYLELTGNLRQLDDGQRQLATNSSARLINEQLTLTFSAFDESRLALKVALRDVGRDAYGKLAFMSDSLRFLAALSDEQRDFLAQRRGRRAVCTLGVALPHVCVPYDSILGTPRTNAKFAAVKVGKLSVAQIADELGDELDELAPKIGIPADELCFIREQCAGRQSSGSSQPALVLLVHWLKLAGGSDEQRAEDLARALAAIGRRDLASAMGVEVRQRQMSTSIRELLREIDEIPIARSRQQSTDNLAQSRAASSASLSRRHSQKVYSSSDDHDHDDRHFAAKQSQQQKKLRRKKSR